MVVDQNQCLLDMALQHCGDAEALFGIALANDLELCQFVPAGTDLLQPDVIKADVVKYLAEKKAVPATWDEIVVTGDDSAEGGISIWAIADDFIVS